MKRAALFLACLWLAVPLLAQKAVNAPANSTANTTVEEKIDTPLEYYFGALALLAVLMTWAWVWLRIKDRAKLPPPVFESGDEAAEDPIDQSAEEAAETERDS